MGQWGGRCSGRAVPALPTGIDIRDGFLKLRPYLAPTAVEAERARGPAVELTGHKLRADVEAAAVAAAIRASRRGRPAQSQPPGEAGRMPGGANLSSETEWLLAVAARYRRHARPGLAL